MNMRENNKEFIAEMNRDKDGEIESSTSEADNAARATLISGIHRTHSPIPGSNHRAVPRPVTARDLQSILAALDDAAYKVRKLIEVAEK